MAHGTALRPPEAAERPGIAAFVALPVLYLLGAALGSRLILTPESISLLWPCNAVLLAALGRYGGRSWGVFALLAIGAELAADLQHGFTVSSALVFGMTNVVEASVAWLLLRAWDVDLRFERAADIGRFVLLGPFAAGLFGALFGTLFLGAVEGWTPGLPNAVFTWWFGDGLGLLVFTPLLLGFWMPPRGEPERVGTVTKLDLAMLTGALVVLALLLGIAEHQIPRLHLRPMMITPFLVYAAVRLPFRWVCVVVTLLCVVFVAVTTTPYSPFGPGEPELQAIWAQEYVLVMAVVGLSISVLLKEVRSHERQISRANVELRRRAEALEHSNAELRRIAFVAAHDLLTPLRAIGGFTQLLHLQFAGKLGTTADDWIRRITESTLRLEALVRDIGTLAAIDADTTPFGPVDTAAVADAVIRELSPTIRETGATVSRGELPVVTGHRDHLSSVLRELVYNALKFRGERPPRIDISCRPGAGEWVFSVQDDGPGIPLDEQPRLFDLFYRGPRASGTPGTGFGLAMCARVTHQHGGRIWVESAPGGGTTFSFTIPRQGPP